MSNPYNTSGESMLDKLGGFSNIEGLPSTVLPSSGNQSTQAPIEETVDYVGASSDEVQIAAKSDLDFLAALTMPEVFQYCFPPVFKSVWQWLLSFVFTIRTFPQLALGLPRGFGKTTLIKLFILYCILFTNRKFILIISSTASLAEGILSDVADMLDEPNIKNTFGDWRLGVEKDTQKIKKFGFRGRNVILAAIGAQGSLRGLNLKNQRPDVMIFEDVQTRECADSEIESTKLENWMIGTAMKAKSPHGCMFLFIGNMYPTKHSILRKLKKNPTWTKFIAGGILEDGTSLWEELQPIEQLMAEFENDVAMGHPEIFYSEVLNDENASANNLIDLNKLPELPFEEGDIPAGKFIVIDPSNDKRGSDEVSVGYFEVHDASPILMELDEGRMSPGDTIRSALKFALKHNCRLIAVESNAYQYSLLYWFNHICTQIQLTGIECVDIYSGSKSKNSRILTMLRAYAAGELYAIGDAKLSLHSQILGFNPLKTDNTDGVLDLMTYAPRVMSEFAEFVVSTNLIQMQEFEALEVPEFNSCF